MTSFDSSTSVKTDSISAASRMALAGSTKTSTSESLSAIVPQTQNQSSTGLISLSKASESPEGSIWISTVVTSGSSTAFFSSDNSTTADVLYSEGRGGSLSFTGYHLMMLISTVFLWVV